MTKNAKRKTRRLYILATMLLVTIRSAEAAVPPATYLDLCDIGTEVGCDYQSSDFVPCETDSECERLNPRLGEFHPYGLE